MPNERFFCLILTDSVVKVRSTLIEQKQAFLRGDFDIKWHKTNEFPISHFSGKFGQLCVDQVVHFSGKPSERPKPQKTLEPAYDGPTGDQPSPITGIVSPTRAYTLTGLTNYTFYTVTLNAMLESTPFLTDTVRVMPSDIFIYLPFVLKGS